MRREKMPIDDRIYQLYRDLLTGTGFRHEESIVIASHVLKVTEQKVIETLKKMGVEKCF